MRPQVVLCAALIAFARATLSSSLPCTNPVSSCNPDKDYFPEKIALRHSTTADLKFTNTYIDLIVKTAQGDSIRHRLVRCGCTPGNVSNDTQVVHIPPQSLYIDDGPTLGILTHSIPQVDRITAIGNPGFIYSTAVRSRFGATDATSIESLGDRNDIDVSFINLDTVSRYQGTNTSIPFFASGESDEATPLGRSEWIKIIALMFDAVESATLSFDEIERSYGEARMLAQSAKRRPSVLVNFPFINAVPKWYLPSEKQYITALLRDANVGYIFMNDGGNDTLALNLEDVVAKFRWARYLIHTGPYPPPKSRSLSAIFLNETSVDGTTNTKAVAANKALRSLASVHCANVWMQLKRVSSYKDPSANDFFEYGATRPDLLLHDIVRMVHPNVAITKEPFFSYKLNDAPASVKGGKCPYNERMLFKAPEGLQYVDTAMNIIGLDRFQVEELLVENIIPMVSRDVNIDPGAIDGFFEKAANNDTIMLVLRIMVKRDAVSAALANARDLIRPVSSALGLNASVQFVVARTTGRIDQTAESTSGLGVSVVIGIIIGLIALSVVAGGLLFWMGRKIGSTRGENNMRDRYWSEMGVRLMDDARLEEDDATGRERESVMRC